MVVLESLSPVERAAYLLRHIRLWLRRDRDHPGKADQNCRQLVHRAEASIRERRPRFDPDPRAVERITCAFLQACRRRRHGRSARVAGRGRGGIRATEGARCRRRWCRSRRGSRGPIVPGDHAAGSGRMAGPAGKRQRGAWPADRDRRSHRAGDDVGNRGRADCHVFCRARIRKSLRGVRGSGLRQHVSRSI